MWEEGRQLIAEVFFEDKIELYENAIVENEIGEELETPTLVGEYDCNIQNSPTTVQSTVSGQSIPQQLRISTTKFLPLAADKTYSIKITKARIAFTDEMWKLDSYVEGQLSTVLTVSRKVSV